MIFGVNPLIAVGVLASTAATDAAYVFFNAAVTGRRRVWAANWSAIWYLLSAFAVISYTENAIYVLFAATGLASGLFWIEPIGWPSRGDVLPSGAAQCGAPRFFWRGARAPGALRS